MSVLKTCPIFRSFLGYEDLDVVNPDGSRPEEAKVDANDVSLLYTAVLEQVAI